MEPEAKNSRGTTNIMQRTLITCCNGVAPSPRVHHLYIQLAHSAHLNMSGMFSDKRNTSSGKEIQKFVPRAFLESLVQI